MANETEYDIVFAGGGTSACVTAGRLASADPSLKILILEAGKHVIGLPEHIQPALSPRHLAPTSTTVSFNVSKPSEHLDGRTVVVPSGRCVGGGSSVNYMMYARAAASDYDDWKNVHGNPGWGATDLLPLLKKTENYQVEPLSPEGISHEGEDTHGYDGPLKVSAGWQLANLGQEFLDVAAAFDKERGLTDDLNGLYSCNKYGRWPKWIDGKTGRRSDAAHHFIYNQTDNKNLQVLDGCKVKRVIFEHNRAVGVEYINDTITRPDADESVHVARASRLVVVAGGAFGSPTILERSGIGRKSILEKVGVQQIAEVPGVGENYQDHFGAFVPMLADDSAHTLDSIFRGDDLMEHETQWTQEGNGLLARNGVDAGIKFRPTAEDLEVLGPEFALRWAEYFANSPDKHVVLIGMGAAYPDDHLKEQRRKHFSMFYFLGYPVSRGHVHITSGENPQAALDFDSGMLSEPADLAVLRLAYKKTRELARRMSFYRGELLSRAPKFADGAAVTCGEDSLPVDIFAPNLVYTPEDDKAIDTFHRTFTFATWHSMGTCAMKPREKGGVVDSSLNVYGVEGLKVADLSICPANVGSNTCSTALVIGEKAAVIIAQELGVYIL